MSCLKRHARAGWCWCGATEPQRPLADGYLAVYVDAVEWAERPNVAGMARYADRGRFTTKPYLASGACIQRQSNHRSGCVDDPKRRTGDGACPFTVLSWPLLAKHEPELAANPRTALMVKQLARQTAAEREAVARDAERIRMNPQGL